MIQDETLAFRMPQNKTLSKPFLEDQVVLVGAPYSSYRPLPVAISVSLSSGEIKTRAPSTLTYVKEKMTSSVSHTWTGLDFQLNELSFFLDASLPVLH